MNTRVLLLSAVVLTASICASAQSARNPLNREPARTALRQGLSNKPLLSVSYYRADGSPIEKTLYEYDLEGRRVSELNLRWNTAAAEYENVLRKAFSFAPDKTVTTVSEWASSGWKTVARTETSLDAKGKAIASTTYVYNSDSQQWNATPASDDQWSYDAQGRPVEYLKRLASVDAPTSGDYNVRILYAYSPTGELQEETYLGKANGLWVEEGRYTYSFTDARHQTANSYYASKGQWLQDGKTLNDYNGEGNLVRTEYYGRSSSTNPGAYCVYLYADGLIAADAGNASLKVYPNPASDYVNVTVPETVAGATLSLYDASGKTVKTVKAAGTTNRIDLSSVPAGVYFLKAGDISLKLLIGK